MPGIPLFGVTWCNRGETVMGVVTTPPLRKMRVKGEKKPEWIKHFEITKCKIFLVRGGGLLPCNTQKSYTFRLKGPEIWASLAHQLKNFLTQGAVQPSQIRPEINHFQFAKCTIFVGKASP